MQPIFDNVELLLLSGHEMEKRRTKGYKELMAMGILEIEPLTYIRGRSIPNQYMIVDEAQNLTPHEIKTIVTRAGRGPNRPDRRSVPDRQSLCGFLQQRPDLPGGEVQGGGDCQGM